MAFYLFSGFFCVVWASKVVEYRYSRNYGQIFFDYSGNFNHAVNGEDSNTSNLDVISSDRGIFFSDSTQKVLLPPNDVISTPITLSKTLTIMFWAMMTLDCSDLSSNIYFFRRIKQGSTNRLTIFLNKSPCQILLSPMSFPTSFTLSSQGQASLSKSSWELIWFRVQGQEGTVGISAKTKSKYSLNQEYSEGGSIFEMELGALYPLLDVTSTFKYFLWNFLLFDSYENPDTYLSSDTVNCYFSTCVDGCNPGILIDNVDYCLPTSSSIDQSANGTQCSCSNFGCTNQISCLDELDCEFNSIEFIDSLKFCKCFPECDSCKTYLKCKTCKDPNAEAADPSGCVCKEGFYNITEIGTSSTACLECHSNCTTCDGPETCLTCKVTNAIPDTVGCKCPDSTYLDENSCQNCHEHCESCSQSLVCITCVDSNAEPDQVGCSCIEGYFNDTTSGLCVQCHSDCKTCSEDLKCNECYYPNSIASDIGCECLYGFFNDSSSCVECHDDCLSCISYSNCLECVLNNSSPSDNGCSCNEGFYYNLVNNLCQSCPENCSECSEIEKCETCSSSETCLCPQNTYPSNTQDCECPNPCIKCIELTCSKCLSGFHIEELKCKKCSEICKTCSGSGEENCTSCISSKMSLSEGQCKCLDGFYLSYLNSPSCEPCSLSCKTCSGPLEADCLLCANENSTLLNEKCQCIQGFYNDGKNCLQCKNIQNYSEFNCYCSADSESSSECQTCQDLCFTCLNESHSQQVFCDNLKSDISQCFCSTVQEKLFVRASISFKNMITLIFSRPLETNLSESDFEVKSLSQNFSFSLSFISSSEYKLTIKEADILYSSQKIIIYFHGSVKSIQGYNLENIQLEITLFQNAIIEDHHEIKRKENLAKNGVIIGAAGSLAVSIITNDYSCIFNFLNFAEIYASIALFDLEIEDDLLAFLRNLRVQKLTSNIFERVHHDDGIYSEEAFLMYGFKTRSILINGGPIFVSFVTLSAVYMAFKKLPGYLIDNYQVMIFIKNYMEYSLFTRFWIQTFFEMNLCALYSISLGYFKSPFYAIDFIVSYFTIVINIQIGQVCLLFIFLYIIYRRHFIINPTAYTIYETKYSSFFSEFNLKSFETSLFYLIFFIRRFTIAICVTLIQVPSLSFSFSFMFSISVTFNQNLFYILYSNCFKSRYDHFFHLTNEAVTILVLVLIFVSLMNGSDKLADHIGDICVSLIGIVWVLNWINCLGKAVSRIRKKCRELKEGAKVVPETEVRTAKNPANSVNDE